MRPTIYTVAHTGPGTVSTMAHPAGGVFLGVFQVGVAYLLLTAAMRHLGAFEVSLLLLVEPVLNPVWAWLVHGEQPGPWAIAGGMLIVAATTVRAVTAPSRP